MIKHSIQIAQVYHFALEKCQLEFPDMYVCCNSSDLCIEGLVTIFCIRSLPDFVQVICIHQNL